MILTGRKDAGRDVVVSELERGLVHFVDYFCITIAVIIVRIIIIIIIIGVGAQ